VQRSWPRFAGGVPTHRPVLGFVIGLIGVAAINLGFEIFDDDVTRAIPLLLLLVPVSTASVVGGWKASVPLAILTGLAYSFQYVAPIGSIRIGVTEDSASLITYTAVALFISENGRRRETRRREREHQRALLLRSVSHNLRNPLGAIRAASDDLREDSAADPVVRQRLSDLVASESDRLDRIIRNLLSLSRVEAGALSPDIAPEPLLDIVSSSVRRLARSGAIGDTIVQIDVSRDLPEVLVDRVQLDQVLTNLIENGIRHAVGGAAISISAVATGEMVEISVSDQGPGFSDVAKRQAFDFFKPSGETGVEGIGLAVCEAIILAHGGSIAVDDAPDGGARVSFSVPAA
jgi:K+-sensing histidine kinase KdpD